MQIIVTKDLLDFISSKIILWDNLKKYKLSKNKKNLKFKTNDGEFRIELNINRDFDFDRDEVSNKLTPYYYRRLDILHNWFKKYTLLKTNDFNSRASIYLGGDKLGFERSFHFLVTNEDFNKDFNKDFNNFKDQVVKTEDLFYNKFQTLENLYMYGALPIINNENYKFNMNSVDDLFILLRLVYLISPNNFDNMNKRVYHHLSFLAKEKEHPHALNYFYLYDEIIKNLKSIEK